MPAASYPNFAGKHAGEAMFTAADFIAYLRRSGTVDDGEVPRGAVLCSQPSLYDDVLRAEGLSPPDALMAAPESGDRGGGRHQGTQPRSFGIEVWGILRPRWCCYLEEGFALG